MGNSISKQLTSAVVSGDAARLEDLLLSADARTLSRRDADGWTLLHYAAAAGDPNAVAALLSHEEEPAEAARRRAKDGSTPLHLALSSNNGPAVASCVPELLRAGAEADALDNRGRSPLAVAAAERLAGGGAESGAVVAALVGAGADAKRSLPDGTSLLHLAAIRGNDAAVSALLSAGALPDVAAPRSLRTPLHEAAASGSTECARLLLRAGADPRAQDAKGKTPASVALDAGKGKLAVELAEGIRASTAPGWWSSSSSSAKEKTSYPRLHGTTTTATAVSHSSPLLPPVPQHQKENNQKTQKTAAQLELEREWGGAPSADSLSSKPRTAAIAAAAEAAFGGWASDALAPPPPPVASRVAAALAALASAAGDAASGVAGAAGVAAASASSAASSAAASAASAAASYRASVTAKRNEESVEGVATAPMGAVKSVYEVDAQLRATFAPKPVEKKEKEKEEEKKEKEEAKPATVVVSAPAKAAATTAAVAAAASPPELIPSLDFGTLAVATGGFSEASKIGGSTRGVTFAGTLPDGTKVAIKVLDPQSAPPGAALAGLLAEATGATASCAASGSSTAGVLDVPLAVGPTSRAIVTRLAEGGSLDGALRGAPLPSPTGAVAAPPPKLSWVERLELLSEVAAAVAELHAKGLSHGSVRATNVLLDPVVDATGNKWRARVTDAGVASLMEGGIPSSSKQAKQREDAEALGTLVLQCLCGAEAEGLAERVRDLVYERGAPAASLADRTMEIGGPETKKKKKKGQEGDVVIVPGATEVTSLAFDCSAGRVTAAEAARVLSELARGVRRGELVAAKAAEAVEGPAVDAAAEQLADHDDVASEISELERELASLPRAPSSKKAADEKDKVLQEA